MAVLLFALAGCTDVPTSGEPAGTDEPTETEPAPPPLDNGSASPSTTRPYDLGSGDPARWAVDGSIPGMPAAPSATEGGPGGNGSDPSGAPSAQRNGSFFDENHEGACGGAAADPTYANAIGDGRGVVVSEGVAGIVNESLAGAQAAQSGPGEADDSDDVADLEVPDATGTYSFLVRADVARIESHSKVSESPAASNQTTLAELVNVTILDGLVTADVLRAHATTNATAHSAHWSSDGSVLEGVRVDGEFTETSKPWFTLDVSDRFGPGSTITLFETMGHVHTPVKPVDGFAADLKINMVHILLRDLAPGLEGDQSVNIVVSQAGSHSDFPEDPGCRPVQGVHGHSYNMHGAGGVPTQPATYGFATIPRSGGSEERSVGEVQLASNSGNAVHSSTVGQTAEGASTTRAVSEVADVCLLETEAGCTVSAMSVRVEAFAEVTADGERRIDATTTIQELRVAGQPVCATVDADGACRPEANTEISLPGDLGILVLNEQLAMPTEAPECHVGIKVRGIHVEPGAVNARVVVSEAEAAAFFCLDVEALPE